MTTDADAAEPTGDGASVESIFTVRAELGLHARPAGRFAALAGRYECDVLVARDNEWVNGCSVLSILSLAASKGTRLRVRATGDGAAEAVRQLGELIESLDDEALTPPD